MLLIKRTLTLMVYFGYEVYGWWKQGTSMCFLRKAASIGRRTHRLFTHLTDGKGYEQRGNMAGLASLHDTPGGNSLLRNW